MESIYSSTVDALERLQEERECALQDGDAEAFAEADEEIAAY